jgi:hypothetical protein
VLRHPENEQLSLGGIPVGPYSFEHRRAIVKGIGHHRNLGIGSLDEFAIKIDYFHSFPLLIDWSKQTTRNSQVLEAPAFPASEASQNYIAALPLSIIF